MGHYFPWSIISIFNTDVAGCATFQLDKGYCFAPARNFQFCQETNDEIRYKDDSHYLNGCHQQDFPAIPQSQSVFFVALVTVSIPSSLAIVMIPQQSRVLSLTRLHLMVFLIIAIKISISATMTTGNSPSSFSGIHHCHPSLDRQQQSSLISKQK